MAPIPSTTGDIRLAHTGVFNAAGSAVTFAFDAGTDANRHLVVSVTWHGAQAHTVGDTAVTFNGVAATPYGVTVNSSSCRARAFELKAPATGSHTVSVDPSAGAGDVPCIIHVYCYSGVDQTTPSDGYTSATGASGTAAVSVTSAVGDLVWTAHSGQTNNAASGTATGYTERLDTAVDSGTIDIITVSGDASGAATVNTSTLFNTPVNWVALGGNLNAAAAAGPTIDTQPVADTGLINGDAARRTTVYTVEASSVAVGGVTGIVWNEDDTPISDGGVYDIQTTGLGTASASSTLTITRTVKTGTPFVIDADVTDADGTTASDAVNDTWYTGPVISKSSGTTNASGVDTLTCVSDYPNADGEFTVITATAGGVTKQVALHYETPP